MDIGSLTGQLEIEDQFSGVFEKASETIKHFTKDWEVFESTIVLGGVAAAAAVAGVTASIIALGNRGSDVNDVASTFEHFSGSVENADATLKAMSAGVLGTIDDFDLMKASSKLLAADVKLTSDQFGTLTQAAFVLQNQGLGSTKEMLDLVSQAMLTGQTRALGMKIGKIDLTKAETAYAASLGKLRTDLTHTQELEADRIGILEILNRKVKDAGVQQRDFGENMEFAIVKIKNWGDELASSVAKSSHVNDAVKAIGTALSEAFGTKTDTLLKTIVGWIDTFADKVKQYAPVVIRWVGNIVDQVQEFYSRVLKYWDTVPDWFKNIAKEAVITTGAVYLSAKAIEGVGAATSSTLSTISSFATITSGAIDSVKAGVFVYNEWDESITTYIRGLLKVIPLIREVGIVTAVTSTIQAAWTIVMTAATDAAIGFGVALTTVMFNPITLVVGAIAGLVIGLRVLTGSWDFILVPMHTVWQALKDVWTISMEVVDLFVQEMEPQLSELRTDFAVLGEVIKTVFVVGLQQARKELQLLWDLLKQSSQFKSLIDSLAILHDVAEIVRKSQPPTPTAPAPIPSYETGTMSVTEFKAMGAKPPEPAKPSAGGVDRTKEIEDYQKKLKNLLESLREQTEAARLTEDAMNKLTFAELQGGAALDKLAPRLEEIVATHGKLTPAERGLYEVYLASNAALREREMGLLSSKDVTLQSIDAAKEAGLSEKQLATYYGVSTESLGAYETQLKKTEDAMKGLAGFEEAARAGAQADTDRRTAMEATTSKTILDARKTLDDEVKKSTLSTTDYQIDQIDRWQTDTLNAYKDDPKKFAQYSDIVVAIAGRRRQALTVNEDLLRQYSKASLQDIADKTRNTYNIMLQDPTKYADGSIKQVKRLLDEQEAAAKGTKTAWQQTYEALGTVGTILDNIPGKFAEIGAMAARAGQAIMEHLATGDVFGAIVAGATAAIGVLTKLFGFAREGRNAIKEFAATFEGDFKGLHEELARLGPEVGEKFWVLLTQGTPAGNKEAALANITAVKKALQDLDDDISKYGLTWKNLADKQTATAKAGDALAASYTRLTKAGYSVDDVQEAMSQDLNDYIVYAVHAGVKIPAALQPILEAFIRADNLTDAAKNALLGLADSGVPALADIKEAADRYGISLDELGPKVKQLQITELANQYVADWKTLTAATDDWGVLFDKMGPKVQDLVTDAMKYGSELPASMKPMIQAFIDAGRLVDVNGDKLTDLGQLNWATSLTDTVETLVHKMTELVDVITNGVGGALDKIGDKVVSPKVHIIVSKSDTIGDVPDIVGGGSSTYDETGRRGTENLSGGGVVYAVRGANILPFKPRGTDTVPAMLTPGERVLTVSQNAEYEAGGGGTAIIELPNGDVLARATVPSMRKEVKRFRMAKR